MGEGVKTYRIDAAARVCFDVTASSSAAAVRQAKAVLERLEEGVDLDNVDTEDELQAAVAYPFPGRKGGYGVRVVDIREEES